MALVDIYVDLVSIIEDFLEKYGRFSEKYCHLEQHTPMFAMAFNMTIYMSRLNSHRLWS